MTNTVEGPQLPPLPDIVDDVTRREFLAGASSLLVLAPYGCRSEGKTGGSGENISSGTRTFSHAMGEAKVPVEPRRVAALHDTSITWPLLDLDFEPVASAGLEGQIRAGEEDVSDLEFLGQVAEPDIESMAALGPDPIIGLEANNGEQYEQLSRVAPTMLFGDGAFDSPFDYHRRLADLVNRLPEYKELVGRVDRRTEEVRERLDRISPELEVSILSATGMDQIFTRYPSNNPYTVAFDRLGLRFPAAMPPSYESVNGFFSLERLPDFDADVLFLMSGVGTESPLREIEEEPIFETLNASRKEQVFTVSYDEWLYSRVPGILAVYDDIERFILNREIDTSGEFR